jgi:hypothetical protein
VSPACPHGRPSSGHPSSTCLTCRGEWSTWKHSTVYGHEKGMEWCREQGYASARRWFAARGVFFIEEYRASSPKRE